MERNSKTAQTGVENQSEKAGNNNMSCSSEESSVAKRANGQHRVALCLFPHASHLPRLSHRLRRRRCRRLRRRCCLCLFRRNHAAGTTTSNTATTASTTNIGATSATSSVGRPLGGSVAAFAMRAKAKRLQPLQHVLQLLGA